MILFANGSPRLNLLNFRDRAGDERKDEYTRLEAVIEKHQGLIPRVLETQMKSEVSQHFPKTNW